MLASFRKTFSQWWMLFTLATGFLTRFSVGRKPKAEISLGQVSMAFPLVGLALGLLASLVYTLTVSSFGSLGASLLAVATMVLASGAIHEDGLKDSADGIWGGSTKQMRLKIMKDPTSGSYGVLALILVLSARIFFLASLPAVDAVSAILVAAVLSRAAMIVPPFFLKPVGGKLGRNLEPKSEHFSTCLSLAILFALLFGDVVSGLQWCSFPLPKNNQMEVWLRHSPTQGAGCFGGNSASICLPPKWQQSIQQAIQQSIQQKMFSVSINQLQWFCSPLKRARQTAQALKDVYGYKGTINIEPDLAEQNFGDWEGLTHNQVKARYPKEYEALWQDAINFTPPSGESFAALYQRLFEWRAKHNPQPAFFVAHSGTIQAMRVIMENTPLEEALNFKVPHLVPLMFNQTQCQS